MRSFHTGLLLPFALIVCPALAAQQSAPTSVTTATSDPQAVALVQKALAVLTGGVPVADVTMTGTVRANNGSATESGTITLVATSAGQSQLTLALPSGNYVTTQNYAANPRTSTSSGPSGTIQDKAPEDVMGPHPAWFCPALLIAGVAPQNFVVPPASQESRKGFTVQHVSIWPQAGDSLMSSAQTPGQQVLTGPAPSLPPRMGQEELFLDSASLLPTELIIRVRGYRSDFNGSDATHPTIPMLVDEHVEFSDYRQVLGRLAAFHVQVSFGLLPVMDIQLSSITFNTGATIPAN